jgi:hypothetical protein
MRLALAFVVALSLAAGGCKRHGHHHHPPVLSPRAVSIELEVYDPDPDAWLPTDRDGLVFFSPRDLADARVGFVEDAYGQAVLEPDYDGDEAYVLLELWAPGHASVFVEVHLTWDDPHVFRSVAFR